MDTETILSIIRLLTGGIVLFYACYTDVKTRRAANYLWVIIGIIGAILLVVQNFTIGFDNPLILIFVPIMIGLMYLLFQLRLIFGGADAKALMALAILVPVHPLIHNMYPLFGQSLMPAPWVIFENSVILFLAIPLSLFIYNLFKRNLQFPYCFVGYKITVKKAKETFVWPLEKIVDGKRKFSYMPKEFDIDEELAEFEKHHIKTIWVTPKIPFMIPLLAGFIVTFILGDLLFTLMNLLI